MPMVRRYLFVEWEDPVFGVRAAWVHRRLQETQTSNEALEAISRQMGMVAQLRLISKELKVPSVPSLLFHCPPS